MACLSWQACWGCNSLYPRALAITKITDRLFWRPRPVPGATFWRRRPGRSSLPESRLQMTAVRTKRPKYRLLPNFLPLARAFGSFSLLWFPAILRTIFCSAAVPARYRRARLPCIFQARNSSDSPGNLPAILRNSPRLRETVRD